ncbi:hypothetical protein OHB35_30880 [Streptomyces phaeochromogenes]|uniref:Uncharacterized protein n=1 Tax=Streptomyces phaeochromogenes TaxID=1923 RepID=A0ABZ1HJ48_STRPH|nr:hypothetical protein [Streptomyces phaeochromogenes]WSD17286.1 hypothetical protein OHB35_30880 [Streptomyces phaeochromogenes]
MLDLEKDPTPGDPVRVKSLAKSLHDFADDVQDGLLCHKVLASRCDLSLGTEPRYEMQPGTRDALIAAGRGSGDNIVAIRESFGIHLDDIGESVDFGHVKME